MDETSRFLWLFSFGLMVFFIGLHNQNYYHRLKTLSSTTKAATTQTGGLRDASTSPPSTSDPILAAVMSRLNQPLSLQFPTAGDYLPGSPELHLRLHLLSDNRTTKAQVVFGILVTRVAYRHFLMPLLNDLVLSSDPEERRTLLVVVFVTRQCHHLIDKIVRDIETEFASHDGLIEVISVSDSGYPVVPEGQPQNFDHLMKGLGRKFNVDVAFLMAFARSRSEFFVALEDDARAARAFLVHSILDSAINRPANRSSWFILDFAPDLKFSGKFFRSKHLHFVIQELLAFKDEKTYQWLLDHILIAKFCSQFLFWVKCGDKGVIWSRDVPLLFVEGQTAKFTEQKMIQATQAEGKNLSKSQLGLGVNKTLIKSMTSSIRPFKTHTWKSLIDGTDFFWGQSPAKDESLTVVFQKPLNVTHYNITSGHEALPEDILRDAVLEVQPAALDKFILSPNITFTEEGFTKIDVIDSKTGSCSGTVPNEFLPIVGIRLRVLKDTLDWVLIRSFYLRIDEFEEE